MGTKQAITILAVGMTIGVGATLFALSPVGALFEERTGLAWLFSMRGPVEPPSEVVVVAIDQRSADHHRLPGNPREWPRSLHARLIEELKRRGASVIVFDLKFERPQSPNADDELADAIGDFGRVLLVHGRDRMGQREIGSTGPLVDVPLQRNLAEAALGIAPFPVPKLPSGRVSQVWAFHGNIPTLPSLAMLVHEPDVYKSWIGLLRKQGIAIGASTLDENVPDKAVFSPEVTSALRLASKNDPKYVSEMRQSLATEMPAAAGGATRAFALLDAFVRLYEGPDSFYLNFYGPPGTVPTISYYELVSGDTAGAHERAIDLRGKTVFVGVSELVKPSKGDGFTTVFSRSDGVDLSGVEIAATAFANMMMDRALKPANEELVGSILLAVGIIITACASLLPAGWAVGSALAVALGYAVATQVLFDREATWLPLAIPLALQMPLAILLGMAVQNGLVRRQRRYMQRGISYFLPPKVVDGLADHPIDPISVRETAFAICLATDAENFTALAESMPPDQAASFLMAYFEVLAEPMQRHGAEFREFHADSALFAWISTSPSNAVRTAACRAALEAVAAIEAFNARNGAFALRVRIGLNAGTVFMGNIGAGGRFAFRMVGDIVNTASRVEALNKQLGTRVLATAAVFAGAEGLLIRPLGEFRLRGRRNVTAIADIVSSQEQACKRKVDLCRRFAAALEAYREQRGHDAAGLFRAILEDYPDDGPSRFYYDCC